MGSNKLDTGEITSVFTPLLQECDFSFPHWPNDAADTTRMFHNGSSAIADPVSFPYMPLQVAPFPLKDMHGAYQPLANNMPGTFGNAMLDLNQCHNFQSPMFDANSLDVGNTIPCMYRRDLQHPELNLKGTSRIRDVVSDSVRFSSFKDPGINKRIPLIRSTNVGGYGTPSGEADVRNISGPHIHNFIGSGGSSPYSTPNSDGPKIRNFVGSGGNRTYNTQSNEIATIAESDTLCAAGFGFPNKVDGNFLSLGIGSNTDVKSKSDHSSREITGGGLYGAATPQLNTSRAQQATGRSFNLGPNSVDGRLSFQTNAGGFTSLGNPVGGWTSAYNNFGVGGGINTNPNSSQFHNVQKPEPNMQHGFPASSTRDLGIVGDRTARYPNLDAYKRFLGPCSSSSTGMLGSGQTAASGLASKSVELSWTARPTFDQLHKHSTDTVDKLSPESSMASPFIRFKGSSIRQEHSGQLTSVNDIASPCGSGGGLFPKRVGVQVSKDGSAQTSGSGLFPQRLGVRVNEYRPVPAADGLFHGSKGIKGNDSHVAYAAECGQYRKEIGVQKATTGCSQEGLQAQFHKDLIRPTFPTGQAFSTANWSGLSQASYVPVIPSPSLKRRARQPPPAAPRVQRRKITLPPPIHPYILSPQTAPAPLPHIKWKGLDGVPQPIGQKCMLCKRDLSLTPEGPLHQPTVPPSVAVLPCGHTFHDPCLQTITPEDQSKDPPCIPCAMGEI